MATDHLGPITNLAERQRRPASAARSYAADRWLARFFLRGLGDPEVALVLWDGQEVCTAAGPPAVWVVVKDRPTLLRLVTSPSLAFGDGYASGRLEVLGDLAAVVATACRAAAGRDRRSAASRLLSLLPRANPLDRARDNVHHHYDLGNDFYRLWLDERMVYTCAYFPDPDRSLEEAQVAKMDHVCRKLRLRPGESVVEAGCGWGALALHMAHRYGATVQAYNISREQVAYARERARRAGMADRIEFVEADFRSIAGRYDAFVSVGMLEHVHPRNYALLGDVIRRSLKPTGRGLVHSIGRDRPGPLDPWLERRIFPGAYIPALSEFMQVFEPHGLLVRDVENLRPHYSRTLGHWLERFERNADQMERTYGPEFVRTWRLYLVGSMVSFQAGPMQLYQVLFASRDNTHLPWTRGDIYRPCQGAAASTLSGRRRG
jgi:cyclopropane-fatty-acyl-phospholipid synthase